MLRCQGYTRYGKRCHTRTNKDEIYCCDNHKPKNYADILDECNICCSNLDKTELKILRCGHAHHKTCLILWCNSTIDDIPSCPLCRAPIYKVELNIS